MTPTQLKALVPALNAVDDAVVAAWIAAADPSFDVARWDGYYAEGLACWVAHNLTVGSVGDATALKQQPTDPFMRTTYGQRYRYLANLVGMGGVVV